jgi:hypothetical protein
MPLHTPAEEEGDLQAVLGYLPRLRQGTLDPQISVVADETVVYESGNFKGGGGGGDQGYEI